MSPHTYLLIALFTFGQYDLFVRGKGMVVEHQPNGARRWSRTHGASRRQVRDEFPPFPPNEKKGMVAPHHAGPTKTWSKRVVPVP